MTVQIVGLGTAHPKHTMSQDESLAMFTDIVCEDAKQSRLARVLFKKSEVQNRHTCVPHQVAYDWCKPVEPDENTVSRDLSTPSNERPAVAAGQSRGPTTSERMELYARFASDLAIESAQAALASSTFDAKDITHLVTVTCTGFDSPGVDIALIDRLGLPPTTQRVQVGFMGCHGAINGLRTAQAIAASQPSAKVLMCCVELCSLHYRFTWDPEGVIGNALFADGSASLVLTSSSISEEGSVELVDLGSMVIPDSKNTMSWQIGDHGFEMRLTGEVGDKIESDLRAWFETWLQANEVQLSNIDFWGVHPGGPRILSAVKNSLELQNSQLNTSLGVLKSYGNMSSPTVLFILREFLSQANNNSAKHAQHAVLLAFGPGLVAEAALLKIR